MIENIKAIILDVDGVLWRGTKPIGDLKSIFIELVNKKIKYCFATNNSTKTLKFYETKLTSLNIPVTSNQIFSSSKVTAEELKNRYPKGGKVFALGMEGLIDALNHQGFINSEEAPLAVVVGLDTKFTYEKLTTASFLIQSGVPFLGTNGDTTFPSPEGLAPGAGSILAALSAATGQKPEILGKPKEAIFKSALTYLGVESLDVLMVGDRLETDIAGGHAVGCKTALVLTGVSTLEMAKKFNPSPNIIVPELSHLVKMLPSWNNV